MIKIGMVGAGHIANTHGACLQKNLRSRRYV